MRAFPLLFLLACTSKPTLPGTGTNPTNPTTPQTSVPSEDCSNGIDDDADGDVDCDDSNCDTTCDADADGHNGLAFGGDDCDDADDDVNPSAPEICDGLDNDCDALIDDDDPDIDPSDSPWYIDNDGDGYGDGGNVVYRCESPGPTAVQLDGDCDDGNVDVNPGATEVCDGVDNNCDTLVDDDDPLVDLTSAPTWYADTDGDGLGNPAAPIISCTAPLYYTDNTDDCDDSDPGIGLPTDWWIDGDSDGFGTGVAIASCTAPGTNYVDTGSTDCNDANGSIFPGAYETCGDGVDSNCDGQDCQGVCTEIRLGLLEGWGSGQFDTAMEWQGLLANQANYGSCPIVVIDFSLPFTQAAFEAQNITALWSPDSAGGTTQYSVTDIAEITNWLNAGNGGLVTTYVWDNASYDNSAMADLVGFDGSATVNTTITALNSVDVLDPAHPLATGLPLTFDASSYAYAQTMTGGFMANLLPNTTVVMASTDDTNLVVAYEPGPYRGVAFTTFVEYQASNQTNTEQLLYNAAYWASGY